MTKKTKRFCKKIMGEGISRNAARLLVDEIHLGMGIRTVHNNTNQKLFARFDALKPQEMRFLFVAVEDFLEMNGGYEEMLPETGEEDG